MIIFCAFDQMQMLIDTGKDMDLTMDTLYSLSKLQSAGSKI